MPALAMDKETWVVENRITNSIKIFKRNVGEALHPAREDENTLKGIKENIGSLNFAGQYQQDPMAEDGGIIKKEYIKYYDYKSLPKFKSYDLYYGYYSSYVAHINKIVVSWDVAFRAKENSDYSVGITFLQDTKGTIYIIDLIREKLEMPALLRRITQYNEQLKEKFSGHRALNIVEAVGGGLGLAQILKKECGVQAKEAIPTTDKATRLKNIAYLIETGHCLFPNDNPPWLDGFLRELFIFPNGKHDDQCDALSQGLAYLRKGPSHIGVSSQW
jgi:predicted phage terminase large subunit-like protein